MNLDVARSAVQLERTRTVLAAADITENGKCSRPSVLPAERILPYLSNRPVTNQYTAGIVSNPDNAAIGKLA